jgi:NTP pyrophosphatase (non-canonical NTP hydrolase)
MFEGDLLSITRMLNTKDFPRYTREEMDSLHKMMRRNDEDYQKLLSAKRKPSTLFELSKAALMIYCVSRLILYIAERMSEEEWLDKQFESIHYYQEKAANYMARLEGFVLGSMDHEPTHHFTQLKRYLQSIAGRGLFEEVDLFCEFLQEQYSPRVNVDFVKRESTLSITPSFPAFIAEKDRDAWWNKGGYFNLIARKYHYTISRLREYYALMTFLKGELPSTSLYAHEVDRKRTEEKSRLYASALLSHVFGFMDEIIEIEKRQHATGERHITEELRDQLIWQVLSYAHFVCEQLGKEGEKTTALFQEYVFHLDGQVGPLVSFSDPERNYLRSVAEASSTYPPRELAVLVCSTVNLMRVQCTDPFYSDIFLEETNIAQDHFKVKRAEWNVRYLRETIFPLFLAYSEHLSQQPPTAIDEDIKRHFSLIFSLPHFVSIEGISHHEYNAFFLEALKAHSLSITEHSLFTLFQHRLFLEDPRGFVRNLFREIFANPDFSLQDLERKRPAIQTLVRALRDDGKHFCAFDRNSRVARRSLEDMPTDRFLWMRRVTEKGDELVFIQRSAIPDGKTIEALGYQPLLAAKERMSKCLSEGARQLDALAMTALSEGYLTEQEATMLINCGLVEGVHCQNEAALTYVVEHGVLEKQPGDDSNAFLNKNSLIALSLLGKFYGELDRYDALFQKVLQYLISRGSRFGDEHDVVDKLAFLYNEPPRIIPFLYCVSDRLLKDPRRLLEHQNIAKNLLTLVAGAVNLNEADEEYRFKAQRLWINEFGVTRYLSRENREACLRAVGSYDKEIEERGDDRLGKQLNGYRFKLLNELCYIWLEAVFSFPSCTDSEDLLGLIDLIEDWYAIYRKLDDPQNLFLKKINEGFKQTLVAIDGYENTFQILLPMFVVLSLHEERKEILLNVTEVIYGRFREAFSLFVELNVKRLGFKNRLERSAEGGGLYDQIVWLNKMIKSSAIVLLEVLTQFALIAQKRDLDVMQTLDDNCPSDLKEILGFSCNSDEDFIGYRNAINEVVRDEQYPYFVSVFYCKTSIGRVFLQKIVNEFCLFSGMGGRNFSDGPDAHLSIIESLRALVRKGGGQTIRRLSEKLLRALYFLRDSEVDESSFAMTDFLKTPLFHRIRGIQKAGFVVDAMSSSLNGSLVRSPSLKPGDLSLNYSSDKKLDPSWCGIKCRVILPSDTLNTLSNEDLFATLDLFYSAVKKELKAQYVDGNKNQDRSDRLSSLSELHKAMRERCLKECSLLSSECQFATLAELQENGAHLKHKIEKFRDLCADYRAHALVLLMPDHPDADENTIRANNEKISKIEKQMGQSLMNVMNIVWLNQDRVVAGLYLLPKIESSVSQVAPQFFREDTQESFPTTQSPSSVSGVRLFCREFVMFGNMQREWLRHASFDVGGSAVAGRDIKGQSCAEVIRLNGTIKNIKQWVDGALRIHRQEVHDGSPLNLRLIQAFDFNEDSAEEAHNVYLALRLFFLKKREVTPYVTLAPRSFYFDSFRAGSAVLLASKLDFLRHIEIACEWCLDAFTEIKRPSFLAASLKHQLVLIFSDSPLLKSNSEALKYEEKELQRKLGELNGVIVQFDRNKLPRYISLHREIKACEEKIKKICDQILSYYKNYFSVYGATIERTLNALEEELNGNLNVPHKKISEVMRILFEQQRLFFTPSPNQACDFHAYQALYGFRMGQRVSVSCATGHDYSNLIAYKIQMMEFFQQKYGRIPKVGERLTKEEELLLFKGLPGHELSKMVRGKPGCLGFEERFLPPLVAEVVKLEKAFTCRENKPVNVGRVESMCYCREVESESSSEREESAGEGLRWR